MITFLVVGRNDGYGVNLHKRTAISLNFLASLCREPDDEIIYVDCNTPEHEMTLVEAIGDTLTPAARRYLKAYRISKAQMQSAIGDTPLPFSDELSRNVGIRRSNPNNAWLLSTNCDILLQPIRTETIREVLAKLTPRFYLCPRISIPISQWQMLDRMNVGQISAFCDEVIKRGYRLPPEKEQPWLRFASVGDFQLAPREQWFQIGGCEESMKFWGHSDANNAKRLSVLNGGGRTPDLADDLSVLHLDHNVSEASSHDATMVHNDWKRWIDEVTTHTSQNSVGWGLPQENLPLIKLDQFYPEDPAVILKTQRRQRNLLKRVQLGLHAAVWKKLSSTANKLDRKLTRK